MNIDQQLHAEIEIINRTLASFGVDAGTRPNWTTIAGASFVAYGLRTGAAQRISDIARLLPELSERISASRHAATPVRLREMPIALEVAHPAPQPLAWRLSTLRIGAGRVVAGRNYSATPAQDCVIDLDARPHLLVAGTTGSGKSTILRMLLASLAFNAAPDDLRLVLIDRKNEDLVPFARLPHVEFAAWTADDARAAIHRVYAEIRRRTDDGRSDRTRLVLVVDELAQVDADALDILARHIVPVGRSKRVHVIAATQHPTVKLIGDKSNYPARLVGQVVDGATAAIATGRRSTGAELLPGAGAFLFVDGPNLERIQAYNLTPDAATSLIDVIADKWCARRTIPAAAPGADAGGGRRHPCAPRRTRQPKSHHRRRLRQQIVGHAPLGLRGAGRSRCTHRAAGADPAPGGAPMKNHSFRWLQDYRPGMDAEHLMRRYGIPVASRHIPRPSRPGAEVGFDVPARQAVWAEYLLCRAGWNLITPLLDERHRILLNRAIADGATRPVGGGRIRRQGFVASYFGIMDELVGLGARHRERMQPPQTKWKRQPASASRPRPGLAAWLKQLFLGA